MIDEMDHEAQEAFYDAVLDTCYCPSKANMMWCEM